jgi:hypothetical protein
MIHNKDFVDPKVAAEKIVAWKKDVLAVSNSKCVNCERKSNVGVFFIVPPEAGGRIRTPNGVALCRDCRIAVENHRVLPGKISNKTPVNFLISRSLHDRTVEFVQKPGGVGTVSCLIRNMISTFISSPEQFEDIAMFQDNGSEIKINIWATGDDFSKLRSMCQEREMSITNVLKALLLMGIADYS